MGQTNDLFKAALIGSVVGGIAGLLFAPKSGNELREDLAEGYQSIRDGYDAITERGAHLKEKLQKYRDEFCEEEESRSNTMWIGGAIGFVVGATAALLLAQQTGEELREQLGDKYEEIREKAEDVAADLDAKKTQVFDKLEDWKDTFVTILDKLSKSAGKHRRGSSKMDEIVDLALIGLKLFNQFQRRR